MLYILHIIHLYKVAPLVVIYEGYYNACVRACVCYKYLCIKQYYTSSVYVQAHTMCILFEEF